MNSLQNLVVIVQVVSALAIIGLVLLQHGKGADMGAAFGSGASGSLFGATGSSNFMSKSTGVAAAIFFASTLVLANYATKRTEGVSGGIMEGAAKVTAPAPVTGSAAIPQAAPTVPAAPPAAVTVPAAPVATPAPATPAGQVPK
ncbi:preprotein translocase subunit SecG [Massilia sp. TSP1-1-2]|uniref:preprotein translocase subunit SecG n=1 Tax=unclassified Massilia TaxID=2609279 RepID=UPI003CE6E24C